MKLEHKFDAAQAVHHMEGTISVLLVLAKFLNDGGNPVAALGAIQIVTALEPLKNRIAESYLRDRSRDC